MLLIEYACRQRTRRYFGTCVRNAYRRAHILQDILPMSRLASHALLSRRENRQQKPPEEVHRSRRSGWLRAAVLGSDDAIVSTASLMIGVAASAASKEAILIAGVASLVAGSMSMAVGEYVSVSSQRDAEQADVILEKRELERHPKAKLNELAVIYVKRNLDQALAMKVAEQLSARDRLGAHLRDKLKIDQASLARPMQAALISAASFASFAVVPIVVLLVAPAVVRLSAIAVLSLASLSALGAFGAHLGGAPLGHAALRATIGGTIAMAVTAATGRILGVSVG